MLGFGEPLNQSNSVFHEQQKTQFVKKQLNTTDYNYCVRVLYIDFTLMLSITSTFRHQRFCFQYI